MWHEARKQEKKIRGMIVDYRKRADRRKEFYERIRADPTQFLQLHGRKCKINLEASDLTDESHMMKWQGQSDNLIDRFDVRAHLDYIPPLKLSKDEEPEVISTEERHINYERFRILAQNEFLGVAEDNFLKQLQLEEQFGVNAHQIENDKNKKKNSQATAAIGYNYGYNDDSASTTVPFSQTILNIESSSTSNRFEEFSKEYSDESDVDMDVAIDINKIGTLEAHELNNCGKRYGMITNDFFSYLTKDEDEKQSMKALKEQEADKILGGGRKSRRERRSQREKRISGKPLSPPSYAAKEEKTKSFNDEEDDDDKSSRDNSRSQSPEKITYITSFGGEDELKPHAKISIKLDKAPLRTIGTNKLMGSSSFADKVKQNADRLKRINNEEMEKTDYKRRSRSRSRSFNRRRRVSRSRSRGRHDSSRSNSRRRRYSSRSTSGSRRRNYSSRSRSISRRRTRSSRSYSRSSYSSNCRTSRSSIRRRTSYRRKSPPRKRTISKKRSYSRERLPSRKRTISRKKSYTPKKSSSRKRSISKRRSYSSSSTSNSSSSSTSVDTRSSPEKQHLKKSPIREKSPERKSKSASREKRSTSDQKPIAPTSELVSREQQAASDQKAIASSSEVVPIKRYYGRRKDNESSSSLSVDSESDDDGKKTVPNQSYANDVSKVKSINRSTEFKVGSSRSTIGAPTGHNPREKLKKKMQLLLNKQYKADKKAETERIERQMQQQQERDEEMRELALKLRRKQRELRHRYGDNCDSKTESESDANGSTSRVKRRSTSSSSTASSSSASRSSSRNRNKRLKKPSHKIIQSPVKYTRRSRSRSTGRNYTRTRYTRSRSRDYRR